MSAQVLIGEILHGGVGGQMATDPSFRYDPVTQTLFVPAITSPSQTFAGQTTVDFTTTGNTIIGDAAGDTLTVNATTSILGVATIGTSVKLQFRNTTTFIHSASDATLNIGATTLAIAATATTVSGTLGVTGAFTNTGATFANGGVDRSTAAALAIGATNATSVVITPVTTITGALTLTAGIAAQVIFTGTATIAAGGTTTALDLTKTCHNIDADAGGDTFTLADGIAGQTMFIIMKTATGVATITPATKTGFTSVTFNAAGDSVILQYFTTLGWIIMGGNSYTVV